MSFFSLPHFPAKDCASEHRSRDYGIAAFTFVTTTICLTTDGFAPQPMQYVLAFFGWLFLIGFLRGECKYVRTQVAVAVGFAVIGEYFASVYMKGYIYRFGNVPAYVPAGHGLVYLTAVALGRSGLFRDAGLEQSFLIQSKKEPDLWRILTAWHDQEALETMRNSGETPRGVLIFREAKAEPALSIFDVDQWIPLD